jgi:hypothetical protein
MFESANFLNSKDLFDCIKLESFNNKQFKIIQLITCHLIILIYS